MKRLLAFLILLVFVIGCAKPVVIEEKVVQEPIEETPVQEPLEQPETQEPVAQPQEPQVVEEPKTDEQPVQQEQPTIEENIPSEVQRVFDNAETMNSYSYRYVQPGGLQYKIYVKGSRIRIDYLSDINTIFLDKDKKTAEEYCLVYQRCIGDTGKVADKNYEEVYIETPTDWLKKITEAKKLGEASFRGKQSLELDTNIGKIWIDKRYGLIYQIKVKGEEIGYEFMDVVFDNVQDSDMYQPPYLVK